MCPEGGTRACDEVTPRALPRQPSLPGEHTPDESGHTRPLHLPSPQGICAANLAASALASRPPFRLAKPPMNLPLRKTTIPSR